MNAWLVYTLLQWLLHPAPEHHPIIHWRAA